MSKTNMYQDLVKAGIFNKTDIENTKIFENDIIIDDESVNINKKYKIETDNMSNEEVIIALLAKQNIQLKTIKNIMVFIAIVVILGILGGL